MLLVLGMLVVGGVGLVVVLYFVVSVSDLELYFFSYLWFYCGFFLFLDYIRCVVGWLGEFLGGLGGVEFLVFLIFFFFLVFGEVFKYISRCVFFVIVWITWFIVIWSVCVI